MFESCAVVQFLADALAPGTLAPQLGPTKARAEFEKWMWLGGSLMDQLLWQIHGPGLTGLAEGERDPLVVAPIEKQWKDEIEPQLCAQLSATARLGPFLLGEFSAADCIVGHCVRWSRSYGLSALPQLDDYIEACTKREAFVATFARPLKL